MSSLVNKIIHNNQSRMLYLAAIQISDHIIFSFLKFGELNYKISSMIKIQLYCAFKNLKWHVKGNNTFSYSKLEYVKILKASQNLLIQFKFIVNNRYIIYAVLFYIIVSNTRYFVFPYNNPNYVYF